MEDKRRESRLKRREHFDLTQSVFCKSQFPDRSVTLFFI